ncbi:uncharacterized protein LOC127799089 [Diospyros lotus]|uniref:uncharacterized protein LOC127799089 n=1 Tax=Diospyros lotus TaxID=55363 RepID=UPI002256F219|nr:uncharacterized protein LOC127799089 [Diospyros lotus]
MSDEPKWEELNTDCLVNVFGRLGLGSLLLDVPFLCKSWYQATKNPPCWRRLDFAAILDSYVLASRLIAELQLRGQPQRNGHYHPFTKLEEVSFKGFMSGLLIILQGCEQLEHLDARDCVGFEDIKACFSQTRIRARGYAVDYYDDSSAFDYYDSDGYFFLLF